MWVCGPFIHDCRFDELGLGKDVVDALRTLGVKRPSHVQVSGGRGARHALGRTSICLPGCPVRAGHYAALVCRRHARGIAGTVARVAQAAALQAWRSDAQHLVIADQAGSGKTLAYLLPLVQVTGTRSHALRLPGAPRQLAAQLPRS